MKTPRQKIIAKLDKLFSQMVLFRDNRVCQRCGGPGNQTSHVIGRRNLHLRWNLNNALCMDGGCHNFWWHSEPLEAAKWFAEKYPERMTYLQLENRKQVKYSTVDLETMYEALKQVALQTGVI